PRARARAVLRSAAPSLSARMRPPPSSTRFPYTTLFRSDVLEGVASFNYPLKEKDNNLVQVFRASELRYKQVKAQDVFLTVTFDQDRKSTRLNSSHVKISYAVFCLKKKTPARREGDCPRQ